MKTAFNLLIFLSMLTFLSCDGNEGKPSKLMLNDNWKVQSSERVTNSGSDIASAGISTAGWYNGHVPSTVMGVLTANGLYENILEGMNYKEIDRTPFDHSWWYRTEFAMAPLAKNQHAKLCFDGLSYSANVWLNGEQVVSRNDFYGPFRQFSFDITPLLKDNNVLAVEVFRAQGGDPNIGFVDWNPRPADESMGIFREVYIELTGKVDIVNPYVSSRLNTATLDEAWLAVEATLVNKSAKRVKGKLIGQYEGREFSVPVTLGPEEKQTITLSADEIPELYVSNPRVWWCNNLGNPEMYEMALRFETGGNVSDEATVPFGIREIKDYFTKDGDRGFILNGKKVLVKSAGWTDDIFLRDTPETNEIQVRYVKDMNMNSIRFENVWGTSQNIYNLCDKYGLMALVGWSCQWEWENYLGSPVDQYGGIMSEHDMNLIAESFRDQILWLRNHPAIIAWYVGSDMIPRPALEEKYMEVLQEVDRIRPYVAAASKRKSTITGPTGMKMNGPYEYVGPNYWYEDTRYGGAYGFNTETGIGAQLPVLESLQRMIPEDKMWPLNEYWDYHCTTSGSAMNTLETLTQTIENKYGKATGLSDYLRKADLLNYEGTRAMFEAFRVNIQKSTGIVQWMLNSAWPSLYWQVYDYYLIPTAAYYGVKQANAPQQLIYNYKDRGIYYVDAIHTPVEAKAKISLYGPDSSILHEASIDFRVESDCSKRIFSMDSIAGNVFLSLQLFDKQDNLLARNFYCLSGKPDVHDWDKTNWVHTPISQYADFTKLSTLPEMELEVTASVLPEGEKRTVTVELTNNTPVISLMTRLALKNSKGEILYPVFWEDNYVSILPGETRTLKCTIDDLQVSGDGMYLQICGWNTKEKKLDF